MEREEKRIREEEREDRQRKREACPTEDKKYDALPTRIKTKRVKKTVEEKIPDQLEAFSFDVSEYFVEEI
ncbi:hypothetical protein L5515_004995 [Caenorhabditis briggsae]|uniref:Uncharacterized protein n=1 Tax=Caenorhabditis briggsae TaxID=6238 RepID=A0AAE9EM76_CAEBR|nr:hypothetical protein L5515_004995 [Caenorhabditis briggsae]